MYRYVPPEQIIAKAVTYIGDVLLEFTLTFTGSLRVTCSAADSASATEDRVALRIAGAALHRIADGLYISAMKGDRPTIESAGGHRFTHSASTRPGPRTRRFGGDCSIEIPGGSGVDEPAISGSLGYALDVTAAAPSDPPMQSGATTMWTERYDETLASIGAVVLAPVPVATDRAARLYAT
ncbi:MAG: hypothetical protein JWR06_2139 [Jatrophihabitans sp.]|nr:hypothetical protein [Jatrophihabitans sp.]MCW2657946.1 hypothetical protein [Jatrophihabitans sp.]MDT4904084.1 hypothetical protein [Pseudonocardiales bacterium]MDT4931364.1 hypothetical protein [Pseudonocardiales bacterium]